MRYPKIRAIDDLLTKYYTSVKTYIDLGCSDGNLSEHVINVVGAEEIYSVDVNSNARHRAQLRAIKTYLLDLNKVVFHLRMRRLTLPRL